MNETTGACQKELAALAESPKQSWRQSLVKKNGTIIAKNFLGRGYVQIALQSLPNCSLTLRACPSLQPGASHTAEDWAHCCDWLLLTDIASGVVGTSTDVRAMISRSSSSHL